MYVQTIVSECAFYFTDYGKQTYTKFRWVVTTVVLKSSGDGGGDHPEEETTLLPSDSR